MSRLMLRSNHVINVISAVFAIWIVWNISHRFMSTTVLEQPVPRALQKGVVIPVRGIDWPSNGETLLLFLSPHCHYCNLSSPLYAAISKQSSNVAHLVAVFDGDTVEASEYLHRHDVPIDDIRQISFRAVGVASTPTLVLVDHNGKIDKSWIGMLTPSGQADLLGRIGLQSTGAPGDKEVKLSHSAAPVSELRLIPAADLKSHVDNLDRHPSQVIIDTRDARNFDEAHLRGAINIPIDEFEARGPHEVSRDSDIALFCQYCGPCENKMYAEGLFTSCSLSKHLINGMGYSRVDIIADDLDALKTHGMAIEESNKNAHVTQAAR